MLQSTAAGQLLPSRTPRHAPSRQNKPRRPHAISLPPPRLIEQTIAIASVWSSIATRWMVSATRASFPAPRYKVLADTNSWRLIERFRANDAVLPMTLDYADERADQPSD
ncbi:hypothetical protein RGR602_PC02322 (plasmid) [Rhizobium gallicum bv. gallicum R602sp]|uniref:Uncharacterized protein n=1 Tax=Rhizobium gallicum bv. gallicum R602sp TaxID=1041138 RepID=A0A0B4XGY2_9HYPH|nr:hypothetical protein RGR602_PC02322 [Rhizobium gallicum bv. gallicum R602sp]